MNLFTVGHSTRSQEALLAILRDAEIQRLVDVRSYPGSRRYPWFGRGALEEWIPSAGIEYRWLPALGGYRKHGLDPSPNGAWRNASFRNYADYANSDAALDGLAGLLALAEDRPTAIMCSEAQWWRCHRRIISDHVAAAGAAVWHLGLGKDPAPHPMNPEALLLGGAEVVYPAPGELTFA